MRVLVVGDIYGKPGRYILSELLPGILDEFSVDFTIANGENAAGGFGITENIARKIRSYGVDLMNLTSSCALPTTLRGTPGEGTASSSSRTNRPWESSTSRDARL
jgi:hypothetical protein